LTTEFAPDKSCNKKKQSKPKGNPTQNIETLPLSINLFFE
jgi:hypothetical protein